MNERKTGPVLIELDSEDDISPSEAAPIPETPDQPTGAAMQMMAVVAARPPSRLSRWFWRLLLALLAFGLSIWTWDFVTRLIERNQILGYAALGLTGLFVAVCVGIILREWAALARLSRLDGIHRAADQALTEGDLTAARDVTARISVLYGSRSDLGWAHSRFQERAPDILDADGLLGLAETEYLVPLDSAAMREVEAAARKVATVTALVPIALADVVAALTSNLQMIRRIAEIYGGRGGTLGSWRLTRAVFAHLVATGAVAVGDDLIGSIAGGGILSKLSRRFGEGLINGALTARVGVAAMEVCRPLPFGAGRRPSVTGLVQRALAGLFARKSSGTP